MSSLLLLAPILGLGAGTAAAYGATHKPWKRRIHFVKRENIENELDSFDIDIQGTEHCAECGDEITPDEIGTVVFEDGQYRAVCNKQSCLDTYDVE